MGSNTKRGEFYIQNILFVCILVDEISFAEQRQSVFSPTPPTYYIYLLDIETLFASVRLQLWRGNLVLDWHAEESGFENRRGMKISLFLIQKLMNLIKISYL